MPSRKEEEGHVSLREHLESKIKALEVGILQAKEELDRRLEAMNRFRDQLTEQAGTFMTKESYENKHALLQQQVNDIRERQSSDYLTKATYDSRHDAIQQQVNELREFKAVVLSKASQSSMYIATIIAIVGLLASIVAVVHSILTK